MEYLLPVQTSASLESSSGEMQKLKMTVLADMRSKTVTTPISLGITSMGIARALSRPVKKLTTTLTSTSADVSAT